MPVRPDLAPRLDTGGNAHAALRRRLPGPGLAAKGEVILSVQYLRALAAWLVVFYHLSASLHSQFGWDNRFAIGAIGVDIFFVISGYVMAMIAAAPTRFDPATFFLRRFARVGPLYWLVTAGFCVLCLVAPGAINNSDLSWSRVLFSFLFLPNFVDGTTAPALVVGWTLNYEFFFYAIVAASIALSGDRTLRVAALMLAACVAVGAMWSGGMIATFYTQPILLEFVFGILIWNYGGLLTRQRWFAPLWCLAVPAIFAVLIWSGVYSDETRFAVWGVPAAIVVLGGIPLFTARLPWLARLGDWSFSTYLLHVYVIQFFVKFVAGRLVDQPVLFWGAAVVALGVIALASAILYALFERPATAALNRWISASNTKAAGRLAAGGASV